MLLDSGLVTGRRKESVAKVRLISGTGKIDINGRSLEEYFGRRTLRMIIMQPLNLIQGETKYDLWARIKGGGLSGQAGALRLGIARAIAKINPEIRKSLRETGMLTRDPREVERKKYGHRKARKSTQYRKR
ncbi:MAG: 30S ribosomal protein S9 [Candidatus Hydrogenedentota bacterium]